MITLLICLGAAGLVSLSVYLQYLRFKNMSDDERQNTQYFGW